MGAPCLECLVPSVLGTFQPNHTQTPQNPSVGEGQFIPRFSPLAEGI